MCFDILDPVHSVHVGNTPALRSSGWAAAGAVRRVRDGAGGASKGVERLGIRGVRRILLDLEHLSMVVYDDPPFRQGAQTLLHYFRLCVAVLLLVVRTDMHVRDFGKL